MSFYVGFCRESFFVLSLCKSVALLVRCKQFYSVKGPQIWIFVEVGILHNWSSFS